MLNRAQRLRANFQLINLPQSFAQQRNNLQIRQKAAAGFIVSVAYIITAHNAGAGNFTFLSHFFILYSKTFAHTYKLNPYKSSKIFVKT